MTWVWSIGTALTAGNSVDVQREGGEQMGKKKEEH